MRRRHDKPTAIDLFCGAGGLTLGLKRAGFRVVAGVELYPEIAKTYKANHRGTKVLEKDVREVTGKELFELTGLKQLDLLAGCPPCQGFSKLTDKWHRDDPRNDLVFEMARLAKEMAPKMVMMENVPGMAARGKPVLDRLVEKLESLGYVVNHDVLQLADYGVPQSRKRLVLLAGRGFSIPMPEPTHSFRGEAKSKQKPGITVREVLGGMGRPVTLRQARKRGGPQKFNWHVVRDLAEISIRRYRATQPGTSRYSLPEDLRPKCHQNGTRGFPNVYGRMSWDEVAPTITAGFTAPCKGRFGHPEQLRSVSVREAATIQTFPMRYRFVTDSIGTACNLVGNALPCSFAQKVAAVSLKALRKRSAGRGKEG